MYTPQHPLITLLTQNSEMWREILNQIQLLMNYHDNKYIYLQNKIFGHLIILTFFRVAVNSIKLLRPVFYYVFCDPLMKLPDSFRKQLWNSLLMKCDIEECQILILELIVWMQVSFFYEQKYYVIFSIINYFR